MRYPLATYFCIKGVAFLGCFSFTADATSLTVGACSLFLAAPLMAWLESLQS